MPLFSVNAQHTFLDRADTLIQKHSKQPLPNLNRALTVFSQSEGDVADIQTLKQTLNTASAPLNDKLTTLAFRTTVFSLLIRADFELKDHSIASRKLDVHALLDKFIASKRTKQDAIHVKNHLNFCLKQSIDTYKNTGKPSNVEHAISILKKLGAALLVLISFFTVLCVPTYREAIKNTLFAKPETAFSRQNGPHLRAIHEDLMAHVNEHVATP
jgi:hypothetical protein